MKTHLLFSALIAAAVLLTSPVQAADKKCGPSLGCDELDACQAFEAYRIPFDKIQKCIADGFPPPASWKILKGQGSVNLGGRGNVIRADLESPFFPTPEDASTPGNGIDMDAINSALPTGLSGDALMQWVQNMLNSGNNWQQGPATANPPNCSSYKSPNLLSACEIRGERTSLTAAANNQCGSTVASDQNWATLTRNASHAAITNPSTNDLQLFRKSGANLSYESKSPIPKFFCMLRPCSEAPQEAACQASGGINNTIPPFYAKKIFIKPALHYAEVSSKTGVIPITTELRDTNFSVAADGQYILMRKTSGTNFKPPAPNPEFFTSQGALNVDPNCYSADQLFSEDIPKDFGDVMFGSQNNYDCETQTLNPQNYLAASDEGQCAPFKQYYNSFQTTIVSPPGASLEFGRIQNGAPYSQSTVRFGQGAMRSSPLGGEYFSGAYLSIEQSDLLLSGAAGGINAQQFPAGAFFTINDQRFLRVHAPGRIRVFEDHRMQLIDGGTVEDNRATTIREIAPMGMVQFDPSVPITGAANHSIAPPAGSVLPTNSNNAATLPYDTRLDLICEQLHAAGIQ